MGKRIQLLEKVIGIVKMEKIGKAKDASLLGLTIDVVSLTIFSILKIN